MLKKASSAEEAPATRYTHSDEKLHEIQEKSDEAAQWRCELPWHSQLNLLLLLHLLQVNKGYGPISARKPGGRRTALRLAVKRHSSIA
jgi:hypothetical protein